MKLKSFKDFQVSENFQYHLDNGIGISDSVFRLGSDAFKKLFEEAKKYWDEDNIILNDKEAWMVKNLEVGKKAIYDGREVELDTPSRGGDKKFLVYHNSGRKDKDGNIICRAKGKSKQEAEQNVSKLALEYYGTRKTSLLE